MILDPCNGELLGWEIPRPIIEEGREFSGPCGRGWGWVGGLIRMPMCRSGVGHSRFHVKDWRRVLRASGGGDCRIYV